MTDLFYKAFEEKYRGSREIIKLRLQIYLPFLEPLLQIYPAGQAIDLGCGRGEWLEILAEQGFDSIGIDLDDGMLQECRQRNLKVQTADAIDYLQTVPESSVCIVSGFHLAEHLPFDILRKLVQEAKRILVPCGLIILETPNPENIRVGTSTFYLDPTHQRPIPPDLLEFLPEYYGFARTKVLRLQEDPSLHKKDITSLLDVLEGVSPDYAVIAQKNGEPQLMATFNPIFGQEYGITLQLLSNKFQRSINEIFEKEDEIKINHLNEKIKQYVNQIYEKEYTSITNRLSSLEHFEQGLSLKLEQVEAKIKKVESLPLECMTQLHAVYSSSSWRITAPLRRCMLKIRQLKTKALLLSPKPMLRNLLKEINQFLLTHPDLRQKILSFVRYLRLNHALQKFYHQSNRKPSLLKKQLRNGVPILFLDISVIVNNDAKTGIQRVVRSLLIALINSPPEGIEVCPIYFQGSQYYQANQYLGELLQRESDIDCDVIISFKSGDIYLALDLNMHLVSVARSEHERMRQIGVQMNFIVYDILIARHPEWWSKSMTEPFMSWLESIVNNGNNLVCISNSVAKDVSRWIEENPPSSQNTPNIVSFHLGADLVNSSPTRGLPSNSSQILERLNSIPSFLMVGTIEPRKGHAQVLEAFEILWMQGAEVNLVIVGKFGWLVDELGKKIRSHPEAGRKLFWLEGISDEYLGEVYKSCQCLMAASYGEGFGLPLIEAAHMGIPILARDIDIFREIAGDHAMYFQADNPNELAVAVNAWLMGHKNKSIPLSHSMPFLSWKESAEQLLTALKLVVSR